MTVRPIRDAVQGSIHAKKMTNEEKRAFHTEKIIAATAELFGEVGYDKTSMRQIAVRSGLLMGSVYNIFESKDEILGEIICRIYGSAIERYKVYMDGGDSILFSVAFPLSIYLHEAVGSRKAAELVHASITSWKVTNMLMDKTEEWISAYYEQYNLKIDSDEMRNNLLVLFGALGGLVNRIYYEGHSDIRSDVHTMLILFCTLFRLPMVDIDHIVDRTLDALGDSSISYDGKDFTFVQKDRYVQ